MLRPASALVALLLGAWSEPLLAHGVAEGDKGYIQEITDYEIAADGLVPNLLAFNVGVEAGQLPGLGAILILMGYWRRTPGFWRHAYTANVVIMTAGFVLTGYQLAGWFMFS